MSSHLFVPASISFINILQFSMCRSFSLLATLIPKYFFLYYYKQDCFLNPFLDSTLLVYKNETDFCMLILYPETLLNFFYYFISLQSLLYTRLCHLQRDNFTFSYLIWMPFTSFSCLTALTRTSSTMLNRRDENEHPSLPNFRGKAFSISLLSMMLAVALYI